MGEWMLAKKEPFTEMPIKNANGREETREKNHVVGGLSRIEAALRIEIVKCGMGVSNE